MSGNRSKSYRRQKQSSSSRRRTHRRATSANYQRNFNSVHDLDVLDRAVSSISIHEPVEQRKLDTVNLINVAQQKKNTSFRDDPSGTQLVRECIVCAMDKSQCEFERVYSDTCLHIERLVCDTCLYETVKCLVDDSMIYYTEVTCPEPGCQGKLDYIAIREILLVIGKNNALFEKYDQHLTYHQLEQMTGFVWCAHGCGSGQLHGDSTSSNSLVICNQCQKQTCFKHRTIWHTDMSCEQYDIVQSQPSENSATDKWLEIFTKQCPQCKWYIQKNEGCDHMTCRHCKHEFCWECFADYQRIASIGSSEHQSSCSHYQPPPATSTS